MKENTNLNLLAGVPESLDKPGVFVSNLDKLNVPGWYRKGLFGGTYGPFVKKIGN